jgi:hypothetical protein
VVAGAQRRKEEKIRPEQQGEEPQSEQEEGSQQVTQEQTEEGEPTTPTLQEIIAGLWDRISGLINSLREREQEAKVKWEETASLWEKIEELEVAGIMGGPSGTMGEESLKIGTEADISEVQTEQETQAKEQPGTIQSPEPAGSDAGQNIQEAAEPVGEAGQDVTGATQAATGVEPTTEPAEVQPVEPVAEPVETEPAEPATKPAADTTQATTGTTGGGQTTAGGGQAPSGGGTTTSDGGGGGGDGSGQS